MFSIFFFFFCGALFILFSRIFRVAFQTVRFGSVPARAAAPFENSSFRVKSERDGDRCKKENELGKKTHASFVFVFTLFVTGFREEGRRTCTRELGLHFCLCLPDTLRVRARYRPSFRHIHNTFAPTGDASLGSLKMAKQVRSSDSHLSYYWGDKVTASETCWTPPAAFYTW